MAGEAEAPKDAKMERDVNQNATRREGIQAAIDAADVEAQKAESKTPVVEKPKDPPASSDSTDGKVDDTKKTPDNEDEDKALAQQGLELIKALKDPVKAPLIVKMIAEQAGYTKADLKKIDDKSDVKEAKETILEHLREGLGEEFSMIADRLAPAIEKILKKFEDQNLADVRQKFADQENEKYKNQSAAAFDKHATEYFGPGQAMPDNVQKEMTAYMTRVNPSEEMSIKEYVSDAFHFAVGKLGIAKVSKADIEKNARIERNRIDAPSRLASGRVPSENGLKKDNSKPTTRQEAILAAIETVKMENG